MSDESLAEMARLLIEMSRRARLAESLVARDGQSSTLDERDVRDPDVITEYDRRIHASAARTRDELEAAQAEIVELRAKLADTEAMLKTHRERADHAMGELDRINRTRSQALVGRAGDASRLEQELRVARGEIEKLTTDLAQVSGANADLRTDLQKEADAVVLLRGLLGEVVKAWDNGARTWDSDKLYTRAMAAIKEDS